MAGTSNPTTLGPIATPERILPVIDLYTWTTPNGRKISIALEELGLPYTAHAVDISKDEQFKPEFLKISPNNRIPAIVDRDNGLSLMESGAILIDLGRQDRQVPAQGWRSALSHDRMADVADGRPGADVRPGAPLREVQQGQGALRGGALLKEAHRLYGVLDKRLAEREFVADAYSIADMAIWPWMSRFEWQTVDLNQYPNVKRWYSTIAKRPAVQKGYKVPKDVGEVPMPA